MDALSIYWSSAVPGCKAPLPANLLIFFFAGFAWTLWTTRNKMAIEKHFPKAPTDVIYAALSLMQKWSIMLKEGERKRFMQVNDAIHELAKDLQDQCCDAY